MAQMGLTRRDPFWQDMLDFRNSFDNVFSRFFQPTGMSETGRDVCWMPAIECYVKDRNYHVRVGLPGVDPKDVNLQVHNGQLTISGERRENQKSENNNYIYQEFHYGGFQRTLPLPEGVKADQVEADYKNGVLEVKLPLAEAALPRRIPIKGTEERQGKNLAA